MDLSELRDELSLVVAGQYDPDFRFSLESDGNVTVASLWNPAVSGALAIPDGAERFVVRHSIVARDSVQAADVYTVTVVARSNTRDVVITNSRNGGLVDRRPLPTPVRHDGSETYDSLDECIAAFDGSDLQQALIAEANTDCKDRDAHIICCLDDGSCWSVVMIVKPTSWRCWLKLPELVPTTGTFALPHA